MHIICNSNPGNIDAILPADVVSAQSSLLTPGYSYYVFAIGASSTGPLYYLQVEDMPFPLPFSVLYFRVSNNNVPSHWEWYQDVPRANSLYTMTCWLSYPEWNSSLYYEKLLDGDEAAVRAFEAERRRAMCP